MQMSTAEVIVIGVLSIVWAAIGYGLSEGVRKVTGRTPWGLPSPVWALLWFLSLVLGLVLFLIARASDARRAVRMGPGPPEAPAKSLGPGMIAPMAKPIRAGSQFPAYPRPANSPGLGEAEPSHLPPPPAPPAPSGTQSPGGPQSANEANPASQPASAPSSEPGPEALPPPGWHPDPSGRFHYRWWDGTMWTSQVSLSGQHLIDTSPDQRIGQY
ncbi:MAG: DUF2510 domain-containing protein [Acidimicrobiales bacterium]